MRPLAGLRLLAVAAHDRLRTRRRALERRRCIDDSRTQGHRICSRSRRARPPNVDHRARRRADAAQEALRRLSPTAEEPRSRDRAPMLNGCRASEDRGKPISGLRRTLLRDVGRRQYELMAQPTTSEDVNLGLYPEGSASCGAPPITADGLILAAESQGESDVALVYGMFGDGVVSIDLVVDGIEHPASLARTGSRWRSLTRPDKVAREDDSPPCRRLGHGVPARLSAFTPGSAPRRGVAPRASARDRRARSSGCAARRGRRARRLRRPSPRRRARA